MIEGVRGADYRSDIAIDDIDIEDGLCRASATCDFHSLDDAMCGYGLGKMRFVSRIKCRNPTVSPLYQPPLENCLFQIIFFQALITGAAVPLSFQTYMLNLCFDVNFIKIITHNFKLHLIIA